MDKRTNSQRCPAQRTADQQQTARSADRNIKLAIRNLDIYKMNSVRRRLPTLLMIVMLLCADYLIIPLQSFATGKFSSRRVSGWRSTPITCTYAVFQDNECEDLCAAFGEESSTAPLNKVEEEKASTGRVKSTMSYTSQSLPRRPRALWWTETGPDKCKSCAGSGEQTCRFCGGTDFLSAIGGETDALFYDGIGKDCPVCNDGLEVCHKCTGTGWVFSWSRDRNRTDSFHQ